MFHHCQISTEKYFSHQKNIYKGIFIYFYELFSNLFFQSPSSSSHIPQHDDNPNNNNQTTIPSSVPLATLTSSKGTSSSLSSYHDNTPRKKSAKEQLRDVVQVLMRKSRPFLKYGDVCDYSIVLIYQVELIQPYEEIIADYDDLNTYHIWPEFLSPLRSGAKKICQSPYPPSTNDR